MQKGKADPIPLHDGRKSTKTAMLLRNAVMMLKSQLAGYPVISEPLSLSKGQLGGHVLVSKILQKRYEIG